MGSSTTSGSAGEQLVDEHADPLLDVVADGADLLYRAARGIGELPVDVALAGIDRARVATAHGDDDVGAAAHLVGQLAWRLASDVDARLRHHLDDGGVQHLVWRGAQGKR